MDFKNVSYEYRPIPFWSWNEKLRCEETIRQAKEMARAGMGGFFMHARGGLQTEYMGEEWFDNVGAAIKIAEESGIHPWAYDENGWPSGFGNGAVNGLGVEYQQKYLRYEEGEKQNDTTITNKGGYHFYYEINPFYVDTLDKKVIKKFIEIVYQPYYHKYKNRIEGFFTDEPQISRNGIPWSFVMPNTYKEMYGEDLLQVLIELFKPVGDYKNTRIKFWKMVTDLFSENFMKQIYDWCDEHSMKLTGHLVCENTLASQLTSNGACMPHYEYMHMPGVDWLTAKMEPCLVFLQMGSVAQQLGRKRALTESFALCGHNVSFSRLRGILEMQMVDGINVLCPHLEGYSLRGIRKRDYPPAMYEQQPWWRDYPKFIEAMSRIGMILGEGEVHCNVLVMHPQTMAWTVFDTENYDEISKLYIEFQNEINSLKRKHIMFHLGDETIMERHARVENGKLIIGTQSYDTVVVLPNQFFMENTARLLDEFKKEGGKVVCENAIEENRIIDNPDIMYTERVLEGKKVYYFVNTTGKRQNAKIFVGSEIINSMTGEIGPFDGNFNFLEYDSVIVREGGVARAASKKKSDTKTIDLSGEWNVTNCDENILTLDRCDYYFDGELQEKDGYVLNIQERACALGRKVEIKQVYRVMVRAVPSEVYLVCEPPEKFTITINGRAVEVVECGYLRDRAFRKINISGYLINGENIICIECEFAQSKNVYTNIEKSRLFESERNKLTYDMEIESIYLSGKFSVYTDEDFEELDNNAVRVSGGFYIDAPTERIRLENIERQGYLFFSGNITVEKNFEYNGGDCSIELARTGINSIHVSVNGVEEFVSLWNGESFDIGKYLKCGKNKVSLTLVNNLRNMLGPHHLKMGECIEVRPASFFKERCVWNPAPEKNWCDSYCFVKTSVFAGQ